MEKEFNELASAGTFGDMKQPEGLHAISANWVLAWKTNEHGYVVRAKVRLVVRGFKTACEGVYYVDNLAPTPAASCFCLLGAIAAELGLDLCNFDDEQAFVQWTLDVFMRLPQGCGKMPGKIVRLNRSLYDLKQASRSWHNHLQ